jgi:alpha-L-fucosidase
MNPDAVPYPGADGPGIIAALQNGDPAGTVWRPGETDVSIRPGWFYHAAEDEKVKTRDQLVDLYFTSVGRNSKLLLNVPPDRAGLLHSVDVARLAEMRRQLGSLFTTDVAHGRKLSSRKTGDSSSQFELDLGAERSVPISDLREDISKGQVVSGYRLEAAEGTGTWRVLSEGTTIGYRKLDRFEPVRVRRVRLTVNTVSPLRSMPEVRLYRGVE